MTLVDLIKQLKEEFKTNGDRELRPDVTVLAILSPYAPETSAHPVIKTVATDGTINPTTEPGGVGLSDDMLKAVAQDPPAEPKTRRRYGP